MTAVASAEGLADVSVADGGKSVKGSAAGRTTVSHSGHKERAGPGRVPPFGVLLRSLEGDLGALRLKLGLGGLGLLLVDLLQDGLRGSLDGVLGLLEAQAGQLAHGLDDLDFLAAVVLEDDVELILLRGSLGRRATRGRAGGGDRDRRGGLHV